MHALATAAGCQLVAQCDLAVAADGATFGVNGIGAFDVNTACAGFCYGLGVASDMIRAGTARRVLAFGAEKLSDWIDWDDRSTCIIFADGAGAAVVGAADADQVGVGPVAWGSAGEAASTIRILGETTNKLHQEGQAVFRWATSLSLIHI